MKRKYKKKVLTEEHKRNIANGVRGHNRKHSEETKKKIGASNRKPKPLVSERHKGRKLTEEWKTKLSMAYWIRQAKIDNYELEPRKTRWTKEYETEAPFFGFHSDGLED